MGVDVQTWNVIFKIALVFGAIVTAIGTVGTLYTDRIIDSRKGAEIAALQPRRLSSDQRTWLLNKLSQRKGGMVAFASRLMDGESADYADDIASVFKAAGWNVGPTARTSLNDLPGFLTLAVTGQDLQPTADFVYQALNESGVEVRLVEVPQNSIGGGLQANTVHIVVGRRR